MIFDEILGALAGQDPKQDTRSMWKRHQITRLSPPREQKGTDRPGSPAVLDRPQKGCCSVVEELEKISDNGGEVRNPYGKKFINSSLE